MKQILLKFEVKDFAKWHSVFMENPMMREAAGVKSMQIFHSAENPNLVALLLGWDNLEKAKAFSQSQELREAQSKAGVISKPEAFTLEML